MTDQKLADHYLKMMEEVNRHYAKSLFRYLDTFYKEKVKDLQVLEDKINDAWNKCLSGEVTLICYLSALKAYKAHIGVMVKLYNNRHRGGR